MDSSGAGTEINCPSCGEAITIPEPEASSSRAGIDSDAVPRIGGSPINPIASSAAAKVEMHLKVPDHKTPVAALIEKPLAPLEVAAKETDKKMKVKTIKHTDCIEVGHDKLMELEDANLDENHPGGSPQKEAVYMRDSVIPEMEDVRDVADRLEKLVADDLWPLPKYSEMLFIK